MCSNVQVFVRHQCCVTNLVADLFDRLHAEILHGDPFRIFADPPPLRDLIDSQRLPPLPTAGQTTALHYRLHLRQVRQTDRCQAPEHHYRL